MSLVGFERKRYTVYLIFSAHVEFKELNCDIGSCENGKTHPQEQLLHPC